VEFGHWAGLLQQLSCLLLCLGHLCPSDSNQIAHHKLGILPFKGWWMHTHVLSNDVCVIIVLELFRYRSTCQMRSHASLVLFPDLSLWKVRQSVLCLLLY